MTPLEKGDRIDDTLSSVGVLVISLFCRAFACIFPDGVNQELFVFR